MSEQNEQLIRAGAALATIAYNLGQQAGPDLTPAMRETIAAAGRAWDTARRAQPAPTVQADLHDQIMNIPCRPRRGEHPSVIAYKAGHRDARHAAAELVAAAPAHASSDGRDAKDAARWRETLRHVGGTYTDTGFQRFTLRFLSPVEGTDIMRGGVSEHFTKAIDAALAGTGVKGGGS